jgi:hypothetical protein
MTSPIFISDDASTDGTPDALYEMKKRLGMHNVRILEAGQMLGISNNKRKLVDALLAQSKVQDIVLVEDDVIPIKFNWANVFIDTAYKNAEAHLIYAPTDRKYGPTKFKTGEPPFEIEWKQYCSGMIMYFRSSLLREVGNFEAGFKRYGYDHNLMSARCLLAQWRDPGGPYPHCLAAELENTVNALDVEASKNGRPEESTCGDVMIKMRMAGENKALYDQRLSELRVKYSEVEKKSDEEKLAQRLKYFSRTWTAPHMAGPCQ